MPRQLLTILVFFGLAMLMMRACAPKDTLPPALLNEKAPGEPGETFSVGAVTLGPDGSIVSIREGDRDVLANVAAWRRPFQMHVRLENDKKRAIPMAGWSTRLEGGAREFVYTEEDFKIVRRYTQTGSGLTMHVEVVNAPKQVVGFELNAASGVPLATEDSSDEGLVFRRLEGTELAVHTITDLVQEREQRRARLMRRMRNDEEIRKPVTYYRREPLDPGQALERFGILGGSHYLMLEQLASAHAVNVDVYRLADTLQVETWLSINLREGAYSGDFTLRWGNRRDIGGIEAALAERTEAKTSKTYRLENETMRVDFSDRGASILSLWLKRFSIEAGQDASAEYWVPLILDAVPVRHRALSMYAAPETYGARLDQDVWTTTVADDGGAIKFELTSPAGYVFTKVVRLPEEGEYDLGVTVRVRPPAGETGTMVYSLVGPSGSYIADAYRGIIGANPPSGLLIERKGGESDDSLIDEIVKENEPFAHAYEKDYMRGYLRAVGVRGAFFLCALVTEEQDDSKGRPAGVVKEARVVPLELTRAVRRPDGETTRQSLKGQVTCTVPVRDGEAVAQFRLYAGPNRRTDLKHLQIQEAVDFGFFGWIGRALMTLMKWLQSVLGSYGLAIIFMTLIVRACLTPVSYRTQLSMMRYSKRIQRIKPELDGLEKRFGKNRQKLNQERMRIMRENKVGFPLGCLMIFFQIPIWFALFAALRVEFSLRHEPFLWAVDLTMPDRLFPIGLWVIDHFNLLPILMLVLWVIQQKLAPSPGGDDPNVQMQMKMVKFMPYIFFLFLYKYAAALSVYMCVSSAWGIVEAKFVRRAVKRAEEGELGPAPAS